MAYANKEYFPNELSEFIYFRTYSRWREREKRREVWPETVQRYMDYMKEILGNKLAAHEYSEIHEAILSLEVMPSMRLLWSAGKAARSNHATAYNCSYVAPTQIADIAEIMYLLMCGVGVGFSVEEKVIEKWPLIRPQTGTKLPLYVVEDTREGWADALKAGLTAWFEGSDVNFDFSKIRPKGVRLKTLGGRSSGPEPLQDLFKFLRSMLLERQGRRLKPIEVHDLICRVSEVVIMGGVRRAALISLSDLKDMEMREAKNKNFYLHHPERAMANNSAVYNEKPDKTVFMEEWKNLAENGTGERGIFNRADLPSQIPKRRWDGFKSDWPFSGTNPCGEVILKSKQFCNLTEVVARTDDDEESLLRKVKLAAIIGTYQSMLTNFPYLSSEWTKNCEEERLLGVSITGQRDSKAVQDPKTLRNLKEHAIQSNKECAQRFGIHASTAITCVKPSGTVSLLVDASAGLHSRHSAYYLRRIRISALDPLFLMLKEQGFPHQPEVGQTEDSATLYVLEFPMKAPTGAVLQKDLDVIDQLEFWKTVKVNYTEHNPSVTISVGRDEWGRAADWVYENWEFVGGLSFLPRSDLVYQLSPYEEITKEEYQKRRAQIPSVDFSRILDFEKEDHTSGAKAFACTGEFCELDSGINKDVVPHNEKE